MAKYKYTLHKKKRKPHSKKETQNHIQKKKRNPHIGDIGKIIIIAVWQVTGQRSWSPTVNSVCVLHVS